MKKNSSHLYYEVYGTKGPYILLVHSILSSRAQWKANIKALTTIGRPVIVELYGHGRSPTPLEPDAYFPDSYCIEFERIRKKLNADSWFVCGSSLGAALSLRYSFKYSDKVIAQVFTNSRSALASENLQESMEWFAKEVRKNGKKISELLPFNPANSKNLPDDIKTLLADDLKLVTVEGIVNTALYTGSDCSVRNMVQDNSVPTLLVAGIFEKIFLPELKYARENMPLLEILKLDGGHAVNITNADQFNAGLLNFFSLYC